MQLTIVPKEAYGTFFKGDTYLVYSCTESPSKQFSQHIHLWIGAESSTVNFYYLLANSYVKFERFLKKDEQGVGAFKMVELDDHLGNLPIQHRECQNFESERFLSYFKTRGGIR